jgi:diketogulonate reductase-like aldo/keto reductase
VSLSSGKEMVKYVGKEVETLDVCNFSAGQSTQLLDFCLTNNIPRPAVVQNELHPLFLTREVRYLCKRVGIVSQAYASKGTGSLGLMDDGVVEVVASKIEHGCVLLPESAKEERMKTSRDICWFMP